MIRWLHMGMLFPTNSMDDVNTAIQSGMGLLHARVTDLLPLSSPPALAGSSHVVDLDKTWDTLTRGLLPAIERTAFTRYCHWRGRSLAAPPPPPPPGPPLSGPPPPILPPGPGI